MSLTVLLPIIRPQTMDAVVASIAASDIPRGPCVLILDAPGCKAWVGAMRGIGFDPETWSTGYEYPPEGRLARRSRHRAMVKLSQTMVGAGPLLCLEDDILVPPDIFARLSGAGLNATGVQIARHESRRPVIYGKRRMGTGIEEVEGCGIGCLLTTGEAYKAAELGDGPGPVDLELTQQIRPLVVDWGCVCGHMTEDGVLYP